MPAFIKIARAVYDIEEATSMAFNLILEHKVHICFCILVLVLDIWWPAVW